jgi:uncharacterized protein (TIGR00297 family)
MVTVFVLSILFLCVISVYFRLLTLRGGLGAFLTGLFIYLAFGWRGLVILGIFFLTSSLLTKWKKELKRDPHAIDTEDQQGRTAGQVFANGGAGLVMAMGYLWVSDMIWMIMFAGAFAAATADTWASEVGVLSRKRPFHLKEWRLTEPGLSGAVSLLGTIAAAAGASLIAYVFFLLYPSTEPFLFFIAAAGFLGNLADSFLGAWFEQRYYCEVCKKGTEAVFHCQTKTKKIFGYHWMTNNRVNFLSTIIGAGIAGGLYVWLQS